LGDVQSTTKFVAGNRILGVGNQPEGWKPLFKTQRRVLKDRANFDAELTLAAFALPDSTGGNETRVASATTGAAHVAVGPPQGLDKLEGTVLVSEVNDRFYKVFRGLYRGVCHDSTIPEGCDK
jgi:hypothetical protein